MSYAILGLIALFLLSAGYNYIQHSENVKGFAEKVQIRPDGEGEDVKKSFWELAQKCEKAELIGCSEW